MSAQAALLLMLMNYAYNVNIMFFLITLKLIVHSVKKVIGGMDY